LKDLYHLLSSAKILSHLGEKPNIQCSQLQSYPESNLQNLEDSYILANIKELAPNCQVPSFDNSKDKLIS